MLYSKVASREKDLPQQKPLRLGNLKNLVVVLGLAAQEYPNISRPLTDSLNLECPTLNMVPPFYATVRWVLLNSAVCFTNQTYSTATYLCTFIFINYRVCPKKEFSMNLLGVEYLAAPLSAKLSQEYNCNGIYWKKKSCIPASLFHCSMLESWKRWPSQLQQTQDTRQLTRPSKTCRTSQGYLLSLL